MARRVPEGCNENPVQPTGAVQGRHMHGCADCALHDCQRHRSVDTLALKLYRDCFLVDVSEVSCVHKNKVDFCKFRKRRGLLFL